MSTRKMISLSLLVSIAGVLHFVEAMLALPFPVPGLKLGIANIVSVYAVAVYGLRESLAVAFSRVMLGSALAGTLFSSNWLIGLAGAIAACLVMSCVCASDRGRVLINVSVWGAVAHNLAQLFAASCLIGASLWLYIPYMVLFAVPTGIATGIAASTLVSRVR